MSKRVESVLEPGGVKHLQEIAPRLADWEIGTIEKLYRIQTFLAFLLAGLCRSDQRTYWLTDDDEIAANPERLAIAANMLQCFSKSHFAREICLGSVDTVNSMDARIAGDIKDIAAIPDLVGGALVDAWSATDKPGFVGNLSKSVGMSLQIPEKAKLITEWFLQNDKPLRKHFASIDISKSDPKSLDFNWLRLNEAQR